MIRRLLAAAALAALPAAAPVAAAADCPLSGRVLAAGQGLAGVEVTVALPSGERRIAETDALGRFSGRAPEPPAGAVLVLVARKAGYGEATRVLSDGAAGACPRRTDRGDIALEPAGGGAAPPAILSSTVFVAPYALYGPVPEADRASFNRSLEQIIGHRIQSFRSSLPVHPLPPELSIRGLDQPLSMVDRQRIREVGADRLALAVVTGEGELVSDPGGGEVFDLSSEIIVIARHPDYQERSVAVDDRLPREETRPSRLSRHLGDFWGQKAVIALSVRELASLPAPPPRDRLLAVRGWLIELRATMAADNPLLEELNQLLGHVGSELGPS